MTNQASPSNPPKGTAPGEQPGKRSSQERNDPEVQPGAREGQPDSRALRERKRAHDDPSSGLGADTDDTSDTAE
ncbi:hypothetical protein [Pseudoxanthomonas koreensis]|uniref:hypothetical protein n=1 Tax=Pseudoxanthomonas koreensis TaxID=266061 RepID=UPI0035A65BB1